MNEEKGSRILNAVEQLVSCLAAANFKFIGFGFNPENAEPEQEETLADFDWSPSSNWSEAKLRFLHKSKIYFIDIFNNPDQDTLLFSYISEPQPQPQSTTDSSSKQTSQKYAEPECVTFYLKLDEYLELPSLAAVNPTTPTIENKLKEDLQTQFVQKVCEFVTNSTSAQQQKQSKTQQTSFGCSSSAYPNAGSIGSGSSGGIGTSPRVGGGYGSCGSGSGGGMIFVPPPFNRRGPPFNDPMMPRMPLPSARYDPLFPSIGDDDLYGGLPRNLNPSFGNRPDFRPPNPRFFPPGGSGLDLPPGFDDDFI